MFKWWRLFDFSCKIEKQTLTCSIFKPNVFLSSNISIVDLILKDVYILIFLRIEKCIAVGMFDYKKQIFSLIYKLKIILKSFSLAKSSQLNFVVRKSSTFEYFQSIFDILCSKETLTWYLWYVSLFDTISIYLSKSLFFIF